MTERLLRACVMMSASRPASWSMPMADTRTGRGGRISTPGGVIFRRTFVRCSLRYFSFSGRESVEEKICKNLRYNLEQLKISGEREDYMRIVDSLLVGPEIIRNVVRPDRHLDKVLWGEVHLYGRFLAALLRQPTNYWAVFLDIIRRGRSRRDSQDYFISHFICRASSDGSWMGTII